MKVVESNDETRKPKDRPFPWRCYCCGKTAVVPNIQHSSHLYNSKDERGQRVIYFVWCDNVPVWECSNCRQSLVDPASEAVIEREFAKQKESGEIGSPFYPQEYVKKLLAAFEAVKAERDWMYTGQGPNDNHKQAWQMMLNQLSKTSDAALRELEGE